MDHTPDSLDCDALLADLHLVIGGDLEAPRLAAARAHLEGCDSCSGAAARAQRLRQVYFEVANQVSADAPDLWPGLREDLTAEGCFEPGAARAEEPVEHAAQVAQALPFAAALDAEAQDALERVDAGSVVTSGSPGRLALLGLTVGTAAALLVVPVFRGTSSQGHHAGDAGDSSSLVRVNATTPGGMLPAADGRLAGSLRSIELDERLANQDAIEGFVPVWALQPAGDERLASNPTSTTFELR